MAQFLWNHVGGGIVCFVDIVRSNRYICYSSLKSIFSKHRPMLSISQNVRVCVSVSLSVCPSVDVKKFQRFRILSAKQWKEIVSDLIFFAQKRSKIAVAKKKKKKILIFSIFLLLRYRLNVFLPPIPRSDVQIFLDLEFLEKSNGKKWSQI